jgi:hypothetical protein
MASPTNVLQELVAATVPAKNAADVLNSLGWAVQDLHGSAQGLHGAADNATLGACRYNIGGGNIQCCNLTQDECLSIPGSTFDPGTTCPASFAQGTNPPLMSLPQISDAIKNLLKRLDNATNGGQKLPQKVQDDLEGAKKALNRP